jgi:hypothetical protein
MAWTATGLGTIAGITTVIDGITGPATDAAQIASVKTLLLAEVSGISTAIYNGARLNASGDAQTGLRTISISLTPLHLDVAP